MGIGDQRQSRRMRVGTLSKGQIVARLVPVARQHAAETDPRAQRCGFSACA